MLPSLQSPKNCLHLVFAVPWFLVCAATLFALLCCHFCATMPPKLKVKKTLNNNEVIKLMLPPLTSVACKFCIVSLQCALTCNSKIPCELCLPNYRNTSFWCAIAPNGWLKCACCAEHHCKCKAVSFYTVSVWNMRRVLTLLSPDRKLLTLVYRIYDWWCLRLLRLPRFWRSCICAMPSGGRMRPTRAPALSAISLTHLWLHTASGVGVALLKQLPEVALGLWTFRL